MTDLSDIEKVAIERDRDLAWELYEYQPENPEVARLASSVLARVPAFTGMVILLALHHEAREEYDEARRLLQRLIGDRDRQYLNALRKLRDLEYGRRDFAEALRLSETVLREDPEADWLDRMEYASAVFYAVDPDRAWRLIDEAVEMCARTDAGRYADALGQRATRMLALGATPERFLPAAEEAIDADPTEPILSTALAFAYLYDYQPERAEGILLRVLREDPTDTIAQSAMILAKGFLAPLRSGGATIDELRAAGLGELAWRTLRDETYGTGLPEALAALDQVMPPELSASLRRPLSESKARKSGGESRVLAWHDGQHPGSGDLWRVGQPLRLMSGSEVRRLDRAIEKDMGAWPEWNDDTEPYFSIVFTDDAGTHLIEGIGARLLRRTVGQPDQVIAESLADWLWDRVVAFGGRDPRPGRA